MSNLEDTANLSSLGDIEHSEKYRSRELDEKSEANH